MSFPAYVDTINRWLAVGGLESDEQRVDAGEPKDSVRSAAPAPPGPQGGRAKGANWSGMQCPESFGKRETHQLCFRQPKVPE